VRTEQGEREGLVLSWAQTEDLGWQGLVVYVVDDEQTVQRWVPAAMLRPCR